MIDKTRLKEHLTHLNDQFMQAIDVPLLISIGVQRKGGTL
jgi:mRNA interferase MazF